MQPPPALATVAAAGVVITQNGEAVTADVQPGTARIALDLEGDVLSGDIFYRDQTDNSTDCGALTGCASVQEMLGNRPPS